MVKYSLFSVCLLCFVWSSAQTDSTVDATFKVEKSTPAYDGPVFTLAEQMPEYPGGFAELLKFITQNLKYPQMEKDNNIEGKVMVKFVVELDGSVSDVTVVRGISEGLNKEAVRIAKLFKGFVPARQQGKPVRVYFTIPIPFKL